MTEEVVQFPDIDKPAGLDEEDQMRAAVAAARRRGGLAPGEGLVALPAGTPFPNDGWVRDAPVVTKDGRRYDIYVRPPASEASRRDSTDASLPVADPPTTGVVRSPDVDEDAGREALDDVDRNFSAGSAPDSSTTDCVVGFAKGFVEGAVVGYATGLVLGALGPLGAAIGLGLFAYSIYQLAVNWEAIQALPADKKAELIGGIIGGLVGGRLGAKHGQRFRDGPTGPSGRPPKTRNNLNDRQKIHKPGTNEYNTRSASAKGPPSTWKNVAEADELTLKAYREGTVTQRFPDGSPKEVKWQTGEPVGADGESQITVKLNQKGDLHGFPSGPKGE